MTNAHPITLSPELVQQWQDESPETQIADHVQYLATRAAQWGADQELEACCLELVDGIGRLHAEFPSCLAESLRAARRPKPPSLKEQALEALQFVDEKLDLPLHNHCNVIHTILQALEALPND
jgi:hypothetical protein